MGQGGCLMGAIFGSTDKGYRPKDQATKLGYELESMMRSGGVQQKVTGYDTSNLPKGLFGVADKVKSGKLSQKQLDEMVGKGWITPKYENVSTPVQERFTYKPGESGTNIIGSEVKYTPQGYEAFKFTAPQVDLRSEADPYYSGIKSNAIEAAKAGTGAAMNQAANVLGRRGIARSGVGRQELGTIAATSGQNIANISRDIDFQRANQLGEYARQQQLFNAEQEAQRQARQAAEQQFGAQFGSQQAQFGANLAAQQREQLFREQLGQSDLDRAYRQEQYGYQRQPLEDMLRLYGIQAPLAARDVQNQGLLGKFGQLGGAVYGGAQAYGALQNPKGTLGGGYGR